MESIYLTDMYSTFSFDLGRDAVRYIIKKYKIEKMYIPYYLCDVIRHTLAEEGCKPIFYHIDDNFYPSISFPETEYILYPNYFGICKNNIKNLAQNYPKLIVDNAHAYYDKPSGFACFNVGHKFNLPKSTLWIKKDDSVQELNLKQDDIKAAEDMLNLFLELHNQYGKDNMINIDLNNLSCSCIYPFLAESEDIAEKVVKELKNKGKTVYRYWSPLPKSFNEYKFFLRLVPIPVLPVVN